jgi:hypothetical protein
VAKGIRRITAVTGDEAREAGSLAAALDARISQFEALDALNSADLKTLTIVSFH